MCFKQYTSKILYDFIVDKNYLLSKVKTLLWSKSTYIYISNYTVGIITFLHNAIIRIQNRISVLLKVITKRDLNREAW